MIAVRNRPRIGISSCLLGEPVRYNGGDKRDAWLVEVLGRDVEWVPVCPEVEAGFGTPREPMELVRADEGAVLMTTAPRPDLTARLRQSSMRRVDELAALDLDGYVLKAGSPSCAIQFRSVGPGIFAEALMRRLPDLPVADEQQLLDPEARQRFIARVFARAHTGAPPLTEAQRTFSVVRVRAGTRATDTDRVAAEEPLEIRLHNQPFAVLMRTPGADRELAAGFLLAEQVVRSADDLGTIAHCTTEDGRTAAPNVVNVTLANGSMEAIERLLANRRQVTTSSSCGLCGRRTIESLAVDVPPVRAAWTIASSIVSGLPTALRARQAGFDDTGGLHAAGLFTRDGGLVDVAEDVGRHNAVDKIVGRGMMRDALPFGDGILCVSGRASYEIVQKAIVAGVPIVAAVSAPSSLAIELAAALGVTLVGFVRGEGFNIYTHPQRVEP
jgi:FdhD protein